MSKALKLGTTAFSAILAILGIVFTVLAIPEDIEAAVDNKILPPFESLMANLALIDSYALVAFCALFAIGAGIYALITNFKKNSKVLIGIFGLLALVGIGWVLANGSIPAEGTTMGDKWRELEVTEGISRFAGMASYLSYFFLGIAIFSIIYFEVKNVFK
ncbi:MAG: hypothetical protein AAF487_01440 [Bacteroidota bacterium]